MLFPRLIAFLLIAITCGCASPPSPLRFPFSPTSQPATQPAMRVTTKRGSIAVTWSKDLAHGLSDWVEEVELLIGPAIVLEGHGGYTSTGEWQRMGDDPALWCEWEPLVDLVRRLHPDKAIVVLSCNERGEVLRTARVYYPRDIAWSRPNLLHVPYGVSWFRDFAYTGATSRPTR